jgi:Leucine-rich repeat (LRR) protein
LGLEELPQEVLRLTNLTELNLWNNQITEIPEAIAKLSNWFQASHWIGKKFLVRSEGNLTKVTNPHYVGVKASTKNQLLTFDF